MPTTTALLLGAYYVVGIFAVNACSRRFLARLWGKDHPEAQLENRHDWVIMSFFWALVWPLIVLRELMED